MVCHMYPSMVLRLHLPMVGAIVTELVVVGLLMEVAATVLMPGRSVGPED